MQPDQAKAILDFLLPTIEQEHATTLKVIAAMPNENLDYAPSERCTKALDLAYHIASSEQYFMSGVANGAFPQGEDHARPESMKTPADVIAMYKEQTAANLARVKALTGEELARELNFYGVWKMQAIGFLNAMVLHSVHHRGQLSAYLRPMGGKVPAIYGMSADDNPFAEVLAAQAQA